MDVRALLFLIVLFTSWCCDDARVVVTTSQSTVPEWEINDQALQHENDEMEDESLCVFCEVVLVPIVQILYNTTNESETLSLLHLLCAWTFTAKDECIAIVDHYVPLIFNETSRLTPGNICTIVGLCINQTDFSQNNNCKFCNNHQYPDSDQMQIVHEKLLEACNSLEDSVNHYCKRTVMANALLLIPLYPKGLSILNSYG